MIDIAFVQDSVDDAAPRQPHGSLRLDYATPMARRWNPLNAALWLGVRKVVFAGGVALLSWGLVSAMAGVNREQAPVLAAWGAGLAALMVPFPFRCRVVD